MEYIKIEKLRQIVSRTDKTGNEKVDMLVEFAENYHDEQMQVKNINYHTVLPTVTLMQLCPKCNGQGTVSKPPYVAGDVHEWTSSSASFVCDVCNGAKIIPVTL